MLVSGTHYGRSDTFHVQNVFPCRVDRRGSSLPRLGSFYAPHRKKDRHWHPTVGETYPWRRSCCTSRRSSERFDLEAGGAKVSRLSESELKALQSCINLEASLYDKFEQYAESCSEEHIRKLCRQLADRSRQHLTALAGEIAGEHGAS